MFEEQKDDTFLARWLSGELTESELAEFKASPEYEQYAKIAAGSSLLSAPDFDGDTILSKVKSDTGKVVEMEKPVSRRYWLYSAAAAVVILIGFLLWNDEAITSLETQYGQQASYTLPDGSEMIMNAKSLASYDQGNWDIKREINLKGEAYFKVMKGETFTVKTSIGDVSVLGTQFTVSQHNGFFEVTCFEGSVQVTSQNEQEILKPGDTYRRVNGVSSNLKHNDLSPSWIDNESTFKSAPVSQVINALENQYGITIKGEYPKELTFTGSFPHGDKALALKLVFGSLEINYKFEGETTVVIED